VDFVDPARLLRMQFVGGRGHYDAVVRAVMDAQHSVWIATANLKELMVEDHRAAPGRSRTARSRPVYRSIFDSFDDLARRRVDLRILHAGQPSRAFRSQLARHRQLAAGALALRTCPRVHFKAVIVDGAQLYLGSANWTGAGLGAKGTGRRNFELGLLTRDDGLLDQVQRLYDEIWRGGPCKTCKLRPLCPHPLDLPPRALRPTQQ
jgi:phosphatidylserine/phosphatidylglycerophosphate/cardiolipin synthase-like enzyme